MSLSPQVSSVYVLIEEELTSSYASCCFSQAILKTIMLNWYEENCVMVKNHQKLWEKMGNHISKDFYLSDPYATHFRPGVPNSFQNGCTQSTQNCLDKTHNSSYLMHQSIRGRCQGFQCPMYAYHTSYSQHQTTAKQEYEVFLGIGGCCYGYGHQFCDWCDLVEWTKYNWLLQLSDYRCPITANCLITTPQSNWWKIEQS